MMRAFKPGAFGQRSGGGPYSGGSEMTTPRKLSFVTFENFIRPLQSSRTGINLCVEETIFAGEISATGLPRVFAAVRAVDLCA